jgi:hypothetical protein
MPIVPGSRRSLLSAAKKLKLDFVTEPESPDRLIEMGEHVLQLLVAGVDHKMVGSGTWYALILNTAPDIVEQFHEHE